MVSVVAQGDPDRQAVLNYRLTVTNLQRMFVVERALGEPKPTTGEVAENVVGIDVTAKRMENIPEVEAALKANEISPRDYLLTLMAAGHSVLVISLIERGVIADTSHPIVRENVQLWKNLPPEVKPEAEEWKKRRIDPALAER
jgi:hypothetical protein